MLTQNNKIDMIPGSVAPAVIQVSQYDAGSRTLVFKLNSGSVPFVLTSGMTAVITGKKPDQYVFVYEMDIDTSAQTVSAVVTDQMTACAGQTICEVEIFEEDESRIGSANFILLVEKSPIEGGTISDSDIPLLELAIEAATTAIIKADVATEKAAEAAASANSAETSKNQAAGSANTAETYKIEAKTYRDEAAAIVGPVTYALMVDTDGYICLSYTEPEEEG